MKINKRHLLNYSILIPYLALSFLGLIIIYSTTSASLIESGINPFASVRNQSIFWVLSLVAIGFIYHVRLDFLRNPFVLRMVIFSELFLLFYAKFFSEAFNGANGWISVGPITLQPAEYLKLIIVWFLAYTFSRHQGMIEEYDYQALTKGTWIPKTFQDWRTYLAIMIGLVAIQPDLGNATIIVLTAVVMFCISGIAYRWFSGLLGLIVILSTGFLGLVRVVGVDNISILPLFSHLKSRFNAFFNPFEDLRGDGHQMANSYYAMSNGGWFGMGLGNSIEKRGYLPEAQTDFVFSIVIEELGLIGATLILALVFFLILRIFLVGIKARNPFNSMVALGVGGMLLMQVFVNVGGISGIIPSTGVTFPFLSLGGNSLLTISLAIGFVLNIDASEKRELYYSHDDDTPVNQ